MSSVKEIQSVRKACTLIEAVAEHQPLGVSELARLTGIEKSAAHRLAVTLHRAGWLDQTPDGRWRVAAALGRLTHRAATIALAATMRPRMEALRDHTGETVMLVAIEHARLMVHEVIESRQALRMSAEAGSEIPLIGTSAARVIAAHLPPEELETLRRAHPALDDDRALALVRRRGWAKNDGEIVAEARAVGAAILAPDGYPLAALVVFGPTSRITDARMREYGELVAEAARSPAAS